MSYIFECVGLIGQKGGVRSSFGHSVRENLWLQTIKMREHLKAISTKQGW